MEVQWALVLFTVISGTGAWLFAWSSIQALAGKGELPTKAESIVAFVLVAIGGCCSVLHLKHVDRILEALNHPTSGIFVEAAMIGVLCVIIAIFFIMIIRNSGTGGLRVVAVIGTAVGIVFTFACGTSYMMEARAAWMSYLLPLGYCTTAAAAGAGLNALMKALKAGDEKVLSFAGLLGLIASIVALVVCAAYCIQMSDAVTESNGIAWLVILFICLAVTAAASTALWKKPSRGIIPGVIALACGVVGAVAMRVVMWLIGSPLMNLFLMPLD